MKKIDVVKKILKNEFGCNPKNKSGNAFAPANIALCKYWGKRDVELNLPVTSSLSISLGEKGAHTTISLSDESFDKIKVNGEFISPDTVFAQRLVSFLDLFRPLEKESFFVETNSNIPIGAGLASSACGFAALIQALDALFGWELQKKELSILARLGSGSACRSLWQGFVKWNVGVSADGMDSFAEPLLMKWPELRIELLTLSTEQKSISSREAMNRTVATSPFYKDWPGVVAKDIETIEKALLEKDFSSFGKAVESNAIAMHALMLTASPSILYSKPETIALIKKIWQKRAEGLKVYFTQDAGPNLKLLFLAADAAEIKKSFLE
jgi:diphosphomevalonate decarboxylase